MPSDPAMACAVARLSPVSMTTRSPAAFKALTTAALSGRTRSATPRTPAELSIDRDQHGRGALPAKVVRTAPRVSAIRRRVRRGNAASRPGPSGRRPGPRPHARPGRRSPRPRRSRGRARGGLDDGLGERVFAAALDRGRETDDLVLIETGRDRNARQGRLAFGQRAGLVEHDRIDSFRAAPAPRRCGSARRRGRRGRPRP